MRLSNLLFAYLMISRQEDLTSHLTPNTLVITKFICTPAGQADVCVDIGQLSFFSQVSEVTLWECTQPGLSFLIAMLAPQTSAVLSSQWFLSSQWCQRGLCHFPWHPSGLPSICILTVISWPCTWSVTFPIRGPQCFGSFRTPHSNSRASPTVLLPMVPLSLSVPVIFVWVQCHSTTLGNSPPSPQC